MSFLKCDPIVFVIENDYEILVVGEKKGIFSINVQGKAYYSDNSGVLNSEKNFAKIRIPQKVLDRAKKYFVVFREAIDRKGYFSIMGEPETLKYSFKPLTKTENIKIYHIADVHYCFDIATKTASYFGDDTDLFIFNGDIGEVETEEHYLATIKFVAEITKGNIPTIYTRGNHDARGKLAEYFTDYYPANGKNLYYTFSVGCLKGIVLDCGEDKKDDHYDYNYPNPSVYGGVNNFSDYRQREYEWLKTVDIEKGSLPLLAISHISPVMATNRKGSAGDIEHVCYSAWNEELERLGVKYMLCGHLHDSYIVEKDDERNIIPHTYPVIFGSRLSNVKYEKDGMKCGQFFGAAIIVNPNEIEVAFTDNEHKILDKVHVIKF